MTMTLTDARRFFLREYEANYRDDSDFYVMWWDDETGKVESACYNTTRFAGGESEAAFRERMGIAPFNAMPLATRRRFHAYLFHVALVRLMSTADDAIRPKVGERAVFTEPYRPRKKGRRGAEVGDAGNVVWRKMDHYAGPFYRNGYKRYVPDIDDRVGVSLDPDGETVFVSITKVEREGASVNARAIRRRAGEIARTGIADFLRPTAGRNANLL